MDCEDESANLSSSNDQNRRSTSESQEPEVARTSLAAKETLIAPAVDTIASSSQNNVVMEKNSSLTMLQQHKSYNQKIYCIALTNFYWQQSWALSTSGTWRKLRYFFPFYNVSFCTSKILLCSFQLLFLKIIK